MATSEGCCHLTGAMLNLAAKAADRARITLYIRRPCLFSASFVAMTSNVEVNSTDLQKSENLIKVHISKKSHLFLYLSLLATTLLDRVLSRVDKRSNDKKIKLSAFVFLLEFSQTFTRCEYFVA
jgi:hypothetical protein